MRGQFNGKSGSCWTLTIAQCWEARKKPTISIQPAVDDGGQNTQPLFDYKNYARARNKVEEPAGPWDLLVCAVIIGGIQMRENLENFP